MGYETLGCNGGISYSTPVLDQMAREGVRFTHCYSQPLCTPSRVKLMTGRSNRRNYVQFGYLDVSERTFAHDLKDAGYVWYTPNMAGRRTQPVRAFARDQIYKRYESGDFFNVAADPEEREPLSADQRNEAAEAAWKKLGKTLDRYQLIQPALR